ncbi:MAG: SPOR domain-containing protein [Pseudomonadota bacterium]
MALDDKEVRAAPAGGQTDEATLLKKRARRRLIGAVALALFAAIVLPMVMDHQPPTPLKDIQVRIPSPDEGAIPKQSPPAKAVAKSDIKPIAKPEPKPEQQPEPKAESKPEPKTEPKPEPKAASGDAWEVQLGAYSEPGRVKNLLAKLKELGVPAYTEKVETPNGSRTRVRAGPFPSQDAAEKAKARIRIIGVDGPVAKKS